MDVDIPQVLAACADFGPPASVLSRSLTVPESYLAPEMADRILKSFRQKFGPGAGVSGSMELEATRGGWKSFANFKFSRKCLRMLTVFSLNVQAEAISF